MCGLVGMAGNLNTIHGKMFRDMLIFDTVRGIDSTGVCFVGLGSNAKPIVEKEVGYPAYLWDWKNSSLFTNKGVPKNIQKVMIGHNRAATAGAVTVENAHPFECGHIVGAHNGSLIDWRDLENYMKNTVDSKSIFEHIEKHGVEDCWKSFLGAAALTYWNDKEQTINLIRNSERPLYVVSSEKGDAVFWASEKWMLTVAASRNNVKLELKDDKITPNIVLLAEDYLHVYKVTSMSVDLEEPRLLEKKPEPPTTYIIRNTGRGSAGGERFRQRFQSSLSKGQEKINEGWAEGKEKADKEVRGKIFRISYAINGLYQDGERSPMRYVIGYLTNEKGEQGDRVEIYPETDEEFRLWQGRLAYDSGQTRWKLIARPRIANTAGGMFHAYRISGKHVERVLPPQNKMKEGETDDIPFEKVKATPKTIRELFKKDDPPTKKGGDNVVRLFPGPDGSLLPEPEWKFELIKATMDGCCTGCGNPIMPDEAENLYWHNNHVVLCESCQSDPTVAGYFSTSLAHRMR